MTRPMNTNDPSSESQVIADNFELKHYYVVVQKSLVSIEKKLREVIKRDLTQLNSAVQVKVSSHLSAKNRAIDKLTMGEIVGLLRETKFLDAWKQQFNTDLGVFEMIDLGKLITLRNDVAHETRSEFTQEEAKMVMFARQVTLRVFERQVVTICSKTSLWSPLIKLFKKPVVLSGLMVVLLVFGMFGVVDRSLEGNPKEIIELIERAQHGDINAQIALVHCHDLFSG